jgi:hypothetical protein
MPDLFGGLRPLAGDAFAKASLIELQLYRERLFQDVEPAKFPDLVAYAPGCGAVRPFKLTLGSRNQLYRDNNALSNSAPVVKRDRELVIRTQDETADQCEKAIASVFPYCSQLTRDSGHWLS